MLETLRSTCSPAQLLLTGSLTGPLQVLALPSVSSTLHPDCPPHTSLTVSDKCSWICCCPSQSLYPSQNTPLSQKASPAQNPHPSHSPSTAQTIQIHPSQSVHLIPVYLDVTVNNRNKPSITEPTSITEQSSITVYVPQRVHLHYRPSITEATAYIHL